MLKRNILPPMAQSRNDLRLGALRNGKQSREAEAERLAARALGAEDYRVCLLAPGDLDREMRRHGLTPAVPTERVVRDVDDSHRVVTNGLFVKG